MILCVAGMLTWVSCQESNLQRHVAILVTNPSAHDANGVVDAVPLKALLDSLHAPADAAIVITTGGGEPVVTQRFNNGKEDLLLFESHTIAEGTSRYEVSVSATGQENTSPNSLKLKHLTMPYAGFLWENESAIYVAPEASAESTEQTGFDTWCKYAGELVADEIIERYRHYTFLADSLSHLDNRAQADSILEAGSIRRNHGYGLDAYDVASTLGCGGVALVQDNALVPQQGYRQFEVLAKGPLMAAIRFHYDTLTVANEKVIEHRLVTFQKGTRFNIVMVTYEGLHTPHEAAIGIANHGEGDSIRMSTESCYIAYSDPLNPSGEDTGRAMIGLYAPTASRFQFSASQFLAYVQVNDSLPLTYYIGSGWSEGDCPTIDDMAEELKAFSEPGRTARIIVE